MNSVKVIAKLSLLEFAREKVVWIFLFVAFALYGLSLVLGALSFDEKQRILAHFGWMAILVSNLGIVLFLASGWLTKELQSQTCLMVLARPLSRAQFYMGKLFGILSLSFVLQSFMAGTLYLLLDFSLPLKSYCQVFIGTFCEIVLILAVCFFSATFLRSWLSFLLGLGVFLSGHWMQEVEFFGKKIQNDFFVILAKSLKWTLPNLFQMNWRSIYFLEQGVPTEQVGWVLFHSASWFLLLCLAGVFIFKRRDLV